MIRLLGGLLVGAGIAVGAAAGRQVVAAAEQTPPATSTSGMVLIIVTAITSTGVAIPALVQAMAARRKADVNEERSKAAATKADAASARVDEVAGQAGALDELRRYLQETAKAMVSQGQTHGEVVAQMARQMATSAEAAAKAEAAARLAAARTLECERREEALVASQTRMAARVARLEQVTGLPLHRIDAIDQTEPVEDP